MPTNARKTAAILCALTLSSTFSCVGCSTMKAPRWASSMGRSARSVINNENDDTKLTAEEREARLAESRKFYGEADQFFKTASSQPRESSSATFEKAGKLFEKAAKAHPGSAIAQDAQFMAAESYFFGDYLTKAEHAYGILQKKYPNSRHNDRAAARQFSIAQYWIDTEKSGGSKVMPVNFVDRRRPWFDIDGHGIRVLDQIRFDDPTGKLADDATMAAGVEHFRQGHWLEADEFFTDLRETFTDSEHLFDAHRLGIRTKLQMYAGPKYSRLVLDEASKLIRQTRQRFPDKLRDSEISEALAKDAAEIDYLQAERLAVRANYRERRGEYGAARQYYETLLANHDQTPFAETARDRLAVVGDLPALPEQRLAFLTKIFPERRRAKPLITSESTSMFR